MQEASFHPFPTVAPRSPPSSNRVQKVGGGEGGRAGLTAGHSRPGSYSENSFKIS